MQQLMPSNTSLAQEWQRWATEAVLCLRHGDLLGLRQALGEALSVALMLSHQAGCPNCGGHDESSSH